MPRPPRIVHAGQIYHVLNRGVQRRLLFAGDAEYGEFVRLLRRVADRRHVTLHAFCLMPNHWHLIVRPETKDALSPYVQWLAGTHARRHNAFRGATGLGHVYQGRFRCVPVKDERQLLTVLRYIEANPLRARLVSRAEDWRWSSLWTRIHPQPSKYSVRLTPPPITLPSNWLALVNESVMGSDPDSGD